MSDNAAAVVPDDLRAANTDTQRAANQANAVTGIYGISGTGKSNLADTAAEWGYETFGCIALAYVADLGGFGTKRLSLIRRGIMRVYDPRNHVNPFETMELISLGAFPVTLIDPERGYADPNVPLVLPRRFVYQVQCPQGHAAGRFDSQAVMQAHAQAGMIKCPDCGVVTNLANAAKVEQLIVRHRMFEKVGLRIYDSMTALNEWGLADLQDQSARGALPTTGGGGSLLGAADALISGQFKFGSSSMGQYGFMQNRTYGWLSNIRKIPDQVVPAIATFHVEQSKGDETTGGDMLYGPKIAGNARTGSLPGWLGNLLHTTTEPFDARDPASPLVFRLWLTNHIDPRDPRKIPYVAKHRGTPIGMPSYLEDKPGEAPWSGFSLKVFFNLLQAQLAKEEEEAAKRYPNAPGMWQGDVLDAAADVVVGAVNTPTISAPVVGGGRSLRSPASAGAVAPVATPAPATTTPTQGAAAPTGQVAAANPRSLRRPGVPAITAAPAGNAPQTGSGGGTESTPAASNGNDVTAPAPFNGGTVASAGGTTEVPPAPSPAVSAAAPTATPTPTPAPVAPGRLRRVARPPTQ